MTDAERLAAVRCRLNVTWESAETDARLVQAIQAVTPALTHAFSPDDGEAWGLFLMACLYDFSDALDDFWGNYAEDVRAVRAVLESGVDDGA